MSPLRNYSSITSGGSAVMSVSLPLFLSTHTHIQCLSLVLRYLSLEKPDLYCKTDFNELAACATHLHTSLNLSVKVKLASHLIQSECNKIQKNTGSLLHSPQYDWNEVILFRKLPIYPRGSGSSAQESALNLKVWQIQEALKQRKIQFS